MARNVLINVRDRNTNIRCTGKGDPLLFPHGAQGIGGHERDLDALAEHFDVIGPDHTGFGSLEGSEIVEIASNPALFYLNLLDALKLESVHVVGRCIGGWIALQMATVSNARLKLSALTARRSWSTTAKPSTRCLTRVR